MVSRSMTFRLPLSLVHFLTAYAAEKDVSVTEAMVCIMRCGLAHQDEIANDLKRLAECARKQIELSYLDNEMQLNVKASHFVLNLQKKVFMWKQKGLGMDDLVQVINLDLQRINIWYGSDSKEHKTAVKWLEKHVKKDIFNRLAQSPDSTRNKETEL